MTALSLILLGPGDFRESECALGVCERCDGEFFADELETLEMFGDAYCGRCIEKMEPEIELNEGD